MVAPSLATLLVGMNMMQSHNQPIHHALYPGHDPKLVVAGRIGASLSCAATAGRTGSTPWCRVVPSRCRRPRAIATMSRAC
jgi:hypothetical protein